MKKRITESELHSIIGKMVTEALANLSYPETISQEKKNRASFESIDPQFHSILKANGWEVSNMGTDVDGRGDKRFFVMVAPNAEDAKPFREVYRKLSSIFNSMEVMRYSEWKHGVSDDNSQLFVIFFNDDKLQEGKLLRNIGRAISNKFDDLYNGYTIKDASPKDTTEDVIRNDGWKVLSKNGTDYTVEMVMGFGGVHDRPVDVNELVDDLNYLFAKQNSNQRASNITPRNMKMNNYHGVGNIPCAVIRIV